MTDVPPEQPPPEWAPLPSPSHAGRPASPFEPAPPSGHEDHTGSGQGCRKALINAGLLLGGFVVLLGGCVVFVFRSVQSPIGVANDMMADVVDNDLEAAAQHVSSETDCFGGRAEQRLRDLFEFRPVGGYDFTSGRVSTRNGSISGTAGGTVTFVEDGPRRATVFSVKEGDDWKVCNITLE